MFYVLAYFATVLYIQKRQILRQNKSKRIKYIFIWVCLLVYAIASVMYRSTPGPLDVLKMLT